MNCAKCGKEIDEKWSFCLFCGNKIEKRQEVIDKKAEIKSNESMIIEEDSVKKTTLAYGTSKSNKLKNLFIVFVTLFSLFFISSIVMSVLFYNSNYYLNLLNNKYLQLEKTNNSLVQEHNILLTDYNELQVKYDDLPKDSEGYSELTGRIEEAYELISGQISYIHFLKCINSYEQYVQKLDEYHITTHDEVLKAYEEYWNKVIGIEQDYRNTCINLERKLANNQISYNIYTSNWDSEYNKYDNKIKNAFTDYQNKINPVIEEYHSQLLADYDVHINSISEADKEQNERLNELLEKIKELYKYHEINMPNNGWLLNNDLENFGLKELSDKYQDEIDELYY